MIKRRDFVKLAASTAFVAALPAALAGCATDAPLAGPVPEVGFQHLAPIGLKVSHVEVQSVYQSPMKAPNAEHRFPTSPVQAMTNWANRRLHAVGEADSGVATFVIENAAVIETKLDKTKGLKGLFTYEPSERYDAVAVARLTVKDSQDGAHGEIKVSASRSVEVRENATLAEREKAWFEMIEALMADFNAQVESQIQAHLPRWLDGPGL